jgi:hypothetical protein
MIGDANLVARHAEVLGEKLDHIVANEAKPADAELGGRVVGASGNSEGGNEKTEYRRRSAASRKSVVCNPFSALRRAKNGAYCLNVIT